MQLVIQFLLLVLLVPSVMLLLMYVSVNLALLRSRPPDPTEDASRAVALLLGFALLITFVILNQFSGFLSTDAVGRYVQTANNPYLFLATGFAGGVTLMALVDFLLKRRALSVLIVIMFSASSISLYLFVLVAESRSTLLYLSTTLLVGALVYAFIRPELFRKLRLAELLRSTFRWIRRSR